MSFQRLKNPYQALDIGNSWKEQVFSISRKDIGKRIEIMLLPNIDDPTNNFLSFKISKYRTTKYVCFALINKELKIFNFGLSLMNRFLDLFEKQHNLFDFKTNVIIDIMSEEIHQVHYLLYTVSVKNISKKDNEYILSLYEQRLKLDYVAQKLLKELQEE